jgi:hypothetical protein
MPWNGMFLEFHFFCLIYKLGSVVDEYSWKSEFPNKFWWISPISNVNNICPTLNGIYLEVCLWSYLSWKSELPWWKSRISNKKKLPSRLGADARWQAENRRTDIILTFGVFYTIWSSPIEQWILRKILKRYVYIYEIHFHNMPSHCSHLGPS